MGLEQIAMLSNVVASLAVIASLIFVGIQMRQSSLATRMMTAQINTQIMIENFNTLIDHPDIAAIFSGERDADSVTPSERIRIGNVFACTFRHLEMLHMHQRYGIHEKEMSEASEARLAERIPNPVIRTWWETSKQSYSPSFVAYVDGRILEWLEQNPTGVGPESANGVV
ncbi:MAG: hypothetical protein AAGK23_12110 [Pseudomonadota bacterium]